MAKRKRPPEEQGIASHPLGAVSGVAAGAAGPGAAWSDAVAEPAPSLVGNAVVDSPHVGSGP
jgi:hypothetical protein